MVALYVSGNLVIGIERKLALRFVQEMRKISKYIKMIFTTVKTFVGFNRADVASDYF